MENDKAVEASFKITLLIAKDKKFQTTGETLIEPGLFTACSTVLYSVKTAVKLQKFLCQKTQ